MIARILCFIVGFIGLESVAHYYGVDRVANEIQVLSAVPWVYALYRIEQLYRHHKQR